MQIPIYKVDAFTSEVFAGNPAAVCILNDWLEDRYLQAIASENNLSETAFLLKHEREFEIRWFTPLTEVALCGHATLASAFIIFNYLAWTENIIHFQTRSIGNLSVKREGELLEMDFPTRPPDKQIVPDNDIRDALNHSYLESFGSAEDLLLVLKNEREVKEVEPEFTLLAKLAWRGIIVTATGERSDFVSRFFAPKVGIPEDPVTGSAHCVLIPFWAKRLGKKKLYARQVSKRGGELFCQDRGDRVSIAGKVARYLEGKITF